MRGSSRGGGDGSSPSGVQRILSLKVSGGFLNGLEAEFLPGLNCLIGGRGTGKTTILELIRFALDRGPDRSRRPRAADDFEKLIEANLADGRVHLAIETSDGIRYTVERACGEDAIVCDSRGNAVDVQIGTGGIFSADIYSQSQIEEIADTPRFQLDLIDQFNAEQLAEIQTEIQATLRNLSTSAGEIMRLRKEVETYSEQVKLLPEITERLKALQVGEGDGVDETMREQAHHKELRGQEKQWLKSLVELFEEIEGSVDGVASDLPERIAEIEDEEILAGPNATAIREIRTLAQQDLRAAVRKLQEVERQLSSTRSTIQEKGKALDGIHAKQEKTYADLLEKYERVRGKAKERNALAKKLAELKAAQKHLEKQRGTLGKKEEARRTMLARLSDLKDKRFRLRSDVTEMLKQRLAPTINVRLDQYGATDAYRTLLLDRMRRSNIRYVQIVDRIVQRIPPLEFASLVQLEDAQSLMEQLEIDADRASRIIFHLKDKEDIFEIETAELHDRPVIELKDGDVYKDAASLSTGQKCTTILPILLLESAGPLLIDQPEDNLDNAFVYETVVQSLRTIKKRRQLIFVTHNPNIPVLGDAERVFALESSGRAASLRAAGTVDDLKEEITTILEGGREAFLLRKTRYGY